MENNNLKLSLTIKEAVAATGISRSSLYRAMSENELAYFCIGARRLILKEELEQYIKRKVHDFQRQAAV